MTQYQAYNSPDLNGGQMFVDYEPYAAAGIDQTFMGEESYANGGKTKTPNDDIFCGATKPPKRKHLGTFSQCKTKRQIRLWGRKTKPLPVQEPHPIEKPIQKKDVITKETSAQYKKLIEQHKALVSKSKKHAINEPVQHKDVITKGTSARFKQIMQEYKEQADKEAQQVQEEHIRTLDAFQQKIRKLDKARDVVKEVQDAHEEAIDHFKQKIKELDKAAQEHKLVVPSGYKIRSSVDKKFNEIVTDMKNLIDNEDKSGQQVIKKKINKSNDKISMHFKEEVQYFNEQYDKEKEITEQLVQDILAHEPDKSEHHEILTNLKELINNLRPDEKSIEDNRKLVYRDLSIYLTNYAGQVLNGYDHDQIDEFDDATLIMKAAIDNLFHVVYPERLAKEIALQKQLKMIIKEIVGPVKQQKGKRGRVTPKKVPPKKASPKMTKAQISARIKQINDRLDKIFGKRQHEEEAKLEAELEDLLKKHRQFGHQRTERGKGFTGGADEEPVPPTNNFNPYGEVGFLDLPEHAEEHQVQPGNFNPYGEVGFMDPAEHAPGDSAEILPVGEVQGDQMPNWQEVVQLFPPGGPPSLGLMEDYNIQYQNPQQYIPEYSSVLPIDHAPEYNLAYYEPPLIEHEEFIDPPHIEINPDHHLFGEIGFGDIEEQPIQWQDVQSIDQLMSLNPEEMNELLGPQVDRQIGSGELGAALGEHFGASFWSDFVKGFQKGAELVKKPLDFLAKVPVIGAVAGPISQAVNWIPTGKGMEEDENHRIQMAIQKLRKRRRGGKQPSASQLKKDAVKVFKMVYGDV